MQRFGQPEMAILSFAEFRSHRTEADRVLPQPFVRRAGGHECSEHSTEPPGPLTGFIVLSFTVSNGVAFGIHKGMA